jgi:hypothetical protein
MRFTTLVKPVLLIGLLIIQLLMPWLARKPFLARLMRRSCIKVCPFCRSEIPHEVAICPHCKLKIP